MLKPSKLLKPCTCALATQGPRVQLNFKMCKVPRFEENIKTN